MSEQTPDAPATPPADAPDGQQQSPPEGTEAKTFDAEYVEKLRKENAKYRTEARANAEAANRLKEFEDRDKSEADKLAERAAAAEQRAQELEARALRLEVAAEKNLTPTQARRLVGATREELEADADELLETFKPASTSPRPDPSQGSRSPSVEEAAAAEYERYYPSPIRK